MSDADRERWNSRFEEGAYSERLHPSALVKTWQGAGTGRALDVAAGAGRNSAYLAELGFDVVAIDISSVGLDRARARTPELRTIEHDLDLGLPDGLATFDVVVVVRYLNLGLMQPITDLLNPGGRLVAEVLLHGGDGVGPSGGRFRAAPGALSDACRQLRCEHQFEGTVVDPDGRDAHVAQYVGVL